MNRHAFTFTLACTITTTSFGMLTEVSFKPYIQVLNPKVIEQRKNEECLHRTTTIGKISENNDYYRCFQYALEEITGFTGNIDFYACKHCDISLNEFFQQIPHPKPKCLVVYTDENLNVKHFAVAIDSMNFKSKFGTRDKILGHRLFDVCKTYENHAYFFNLLAKYENNRAQLHQDLSKTAFKNKLRRNIPLFCASFMTGILIKALTLHAIDPIFFITE